MRNVVRVLIVDSDEGFRTLAASGLAEYDYSTTIAENAEEALDYLESGAPCDVVLTDVVMPGIGGVELRRRAQMDPRSAGCRASEPQSAGSRSPARRSCRGREP